MNKLKLYNIENLDGFFDAIDKCSGKVELVTGEGDRLNLKSKLTQYVAFSHVFKDNKIGEMELLFSCPEDARMVLNFCIYGNPDMI